MIVVRSIPMGNVDSVGRGGLGLEEWADGEELWIGKMS